MTFAVTYTSLRNHLGSYLDRVIDDCEILLVKRRGAPDVAIISAEELAKLKEICMARLPKKAR